MEGMRPVRGDYDLLPATPGVGTAVLAHREEEQPPASQKEMDNSSYGVACLCGGQVLS